MSNDAHSGSEGRIVEVKGTNVASGYIVIELDPALTNRVKQAMRRLRAAPLLEISSVTDVDGKDLETIIEHLEVEGLIVRKAEAEDSWEVLVATDKLFASP